MATQMARPFGTSEAIDIDSALRRYTDWGSRQVFLETKIGTIEAGKRADIAIWDRDLYSVPTDQIKAIQCLMTLLDGEGGVLRTGFSNHNLRQVTAPSIFSAEHF
jgi:predicted amidohydrolase YtcJ